MFRGNELFLNANSASVQLQCIHGENKLILDERMMRYALYYFAILFEYYSASSLKQQSTDRHVVTLGNIIPVPSQHIFALSSECCMLS